jgi:hypothetical protein
MSNLPVEANTFAFWTGLLQRAWCVERHHLIDLILATGRVRENWLQADAYLAARTWQEPRLPFFYCNYSPWGYSGAVDWSYWDTDANESADPSQGAKPWMLTEVKVLGGDYAPKTFAGEDFDLAKFIEGWTVGNCVKPDHWALTHHKLGGLLADYRRLISYGRHRCPVRMMVLLLDARYPNTPLGRCLEMVEFDGQGEVLAKTSKWLCKAWEITSVVDVS